MPIFQGFRDMFSLQMKVKMNGYHSSSLIYQPIAVVSIFVF